MMFKVIPLLVCLTAAAKQKYDNYSFDYSSGKLPLAYTTYGNAIELHHKLKLNSGIEERGGSLVLDRQISMEEFEV
jgi:hypothetical protein